MCRNTIVLVKTADNCHCGTGFGEKRGANLERCLIESCWASFCQKHPQLVLQLAEEVSDVWSIGTKPEILLKYCDLLEDTLTKNNLMDEPYKNLQHGCMPMVPTPPCVISIQETKIPLLQIQGTCHKWQSFHAVVPEDIPYLLCGYIWSTKRAYKRAGTIYAHQNRMDRWVSSNRLMSIF